MGSGVGSPDADVVHFAVDAQRHGTFLSTLSWRIRLWVSTSRLLAGRALGIES